MTNKEVIEYVQHTPYNTNPAILKQKLEQQDFENRADWNQNDPMALDYVKNRPFYEIVEWQEDHPSVLVYCLTYGEDRRVIIDGTEYAMSELVLESTADPGINSVVTIDRKYKMTFNQMNMQVSYEPEVVWQCFYPAITIKKLDAKYMPEPDMVITVSGSPDCIFGVATSSNTAVTKGTVNNVKSKILNGEIVDVRILHIGNNGYMAVADEVKAQAVFYNGEIFISWIRVSFNNWVYKNVVKFNENGEIRSVDCYQITSKLRE